MSIFSHSIKEYFYRYSKLLAFVLIFHLKIKQNMYKAKIFLEIFSLMWLIIDTFRADFSSSCEGLFWYNVCTHSWSHKSRKKRVRFSPFEECRNYIKQSLSFT